MCVVYSTEAANVIDYMLRELREEAKRQAWSGGCDIESWHTTVL